MTKKDIPGLDHLPAGQESLARGVDDRAEGTIYVRTVSTAVRLRPTPKVELTFGRNKDDVQVCVGADDRNVSRVQGSLSYEGGHWWLRNLGHRNLLLPDSHQLFSESDPHLVPTGYTPVFIRTVERRTHLLEIFVSDGTAHGLRPVYAEPTFLGRQWLLSRNEKLALVATAQPYLMHEANPEPWARDAVANLLNEVDTKERWSRSKVGREVDRVRKRLADTGVGGLTEDEVGHPVGNKLKHNLIVELMASRSLIPPDIALLG